MEKPGTIYRLLNVLSLDVTAGAVISALFFARILHVHLLIWGVGALGLTVWIIYTVDHLIDAKRAEGPASSSRHRFHQKHFKTLTAFLAVAILIDGIMIFYLRKPVLYSGLALAGAVTGYFIFQRNLRYTKEVCGALLYTVGVLLPAWSISSVSITRSQEMVIAEFGITVLCNLVLFSLFDHQSDLDDRYHSLVTAMGTRFARYLLGILFLINGVLLVLQLLWEFNNPLSALVILLMNGVLVIVSIFHERFESEDHYRLIGDAIFFIPVLFLIA